MDKKTTTRHFSLIHEKCVAKALEGRVVANSGATPFCKGDVNLGTILVDCKTVMSAKKTVNIKLDDINKIREEAMGEGMLYSRGVIAFNFEPSGNSFYVIDETLMKLLCDYINKEAQNEAQ